jgi:hypothetical protein
LGSTTVSIRGNQDCTTVSGETVTRCFDIDPTTKTGRDATITFYFADSEFSGNECTNLGVYHYSGGWELISAAGRYCTSTLNYLWVNGVNSFSPFVLKEGTPTIITLRNLTAQSNARISVALLAATLGFLVAGGRLLYLRRRKVQ